MVSRKNWVLAALPLMLSAAVNAQDDAVFGSGFESGLRIDGLTTYPAPLAGASVQLHVGERLVGTQTAADGSYHLFVESRHLVGSSFAELRVQGSGDQAFIEWVGLIGPADRLLDAAQGTGVVDAEAIPFVNLGPWSTAVSAAMLADNGYLDIADADDFERMARAWQPVQVGVLARSLVLVAQGAMSLPDDSATTWQALTELAPTQVLFADYQSLAAASDCVADPQTPLCQMLAQFPDNPDIFPLQQPESGRLYATALGYDYSGSGAPSTSLRLADGQWWYQGSQGAGPLAPVDAEVLSNGGVRLHHDDGSALYVTPSTTYIGGQPVAREFRVMSETVRFSAGIDGLLQMSVARAAVWHYPDNPELPDQPVDTPMATPVLDASNPLPDAQLLPANAFADGRWLLATPFLTTDPQSQGFPDQVMLDIHAFSGSTGVTERGGHEFTLVEQTGDGYRIDYDDESLVLRLVNQDLPGVWRALAEITSPTQTRIVKTMVLAVDAPQPAWTAGNAPGVYQSYINGHDCDGPYWQIAALTPAPFCGPPAVLFTLNAGGTGTFSGPPASSTPLTWELAVGADAGRLRINRNLGTLNPFQTRGWEIVKQIGDRLWIMEDLRGSVDGTTPPDPVQFLPTGRVYSLGGSRR